MKESRKKFSDVLKMIFGWGIMIVLFTGGLTFFGYLAAFIIGGSTAEAICVFIYKTIVPKMIYVTTVLVLFGILTMYAAGEKALTPSDNEKEKRAESV